MSTEGAPTGIGGLFTTEVERFPLGTHHGHELHARVQRRRLRFNFGRAIGPWRLALDVGRTRPLAIEVSAPGERYDLPIVTADPWARFAGRLGALVIAAALLQLITRRFRNGDRR